MAKPTLVEPVRSVADAVGRSAMALVTLSALGAFLLSAHGISRGSAGSEWLEIWRSGGLFMFSVLFAIVTLRPRLSPGLWELAFLHKIVLAAAAPFSSDPEALISGFVDLILAMVIAASYALTKGWQGWRTMPAVPPHRST